MLEKSDENLSSLFPCIPGVVRILAAGGVYTCKKYWGVSREIGKKLYNSPKASFRTDITALGLSEL